jgi:hypothetical protein
MFETLRPEQGDVLIQKSRELLKPRLLKQRRWPSRIRKGS